jgi:hypothetical protein
MADTDNEKVHIERAIERARNGVVQDIDELDRRLRTQLDFKTIAAEHAPQIIGAGAALGFLVGFGFPKPLRKLLKFGIPLALIGMQVKKRMDAKNASYAVSSPS